MIEELNQAVMHGGIIDEFAQSSLLVLHGTENIFGMSHGGVEVIVKLVGGQHFADAVAARFGGAAYGVETGGGGVKVIVELRVGEQFAQGAVAVLDICNDGVDLIGESAEIFFEFNTTLDDLLDGFYFSAGHGGSGL